MKRSGTLFHTIVVVGASIGAGAGCGADEKVPDARTGAPDAAQVADARPADASPVDGGTPDAMPDAMIIIL